MNSATWPRPSWHNFRFRLGAVNEVNREEKIIATSPTLDAQGKEFLPRREIRYDTLILSVGSISNDFGIPGIREHCHFIDQQRQADSFHQHLLKSCYTAHAQQEAPREAQLHIAIAGAGATGGGIRLPSFIIQPDN